MTTVTMTTAAMATVNRPLWVVVFLLCAVFPLLDAGNAIPFDTTICTPSQVPMASPLPILGEKYSAEIRWTSHKDRRMYYVRDDLDTFRHLASLRISMPLLPSDAKAIFDLDYGYVSVFDDVTRQDCRVIGRGSGYFAYVGLPWLSRLEHLTKRAGGSKDLKYEKTVDLNGVQADHYTACLYDPTSNVTSFYELYYAGKTSVQAQNWQLPRVPNGDRTLPYLIKIKGRGGMGSKVVDFDVTGEVGRFDVQPVFDDDIFLPPPGTWCEGLPLISLPPTPESFTVLAELIDEDFQHVRYEQVWFDSSRKLVRKDWQPITDQTHSNTDPYTTLYDFNIGVKYEMDRYLMGCERTNQISLGDEFTNATHPDDPLLQNFQMSSSADYFHTQTDQVQFLGKKTIRGVECQVYVGYYYDVPAGRNFTVQWYYTEGKWTISTGSEINTDSLLRMEIWKGASSKPSVYNIVQYQTEAPDYDVFDRSWCYLDQMKIHFVLLLQVVDVTYTNTVPYRFLRDQIVDKLSSFIQEKNRFTNVQIVYSGAPQMYVYGTLLDRSPLENPDVPYAPQHDLLGAFHHLEGTVLSHIDILFQAPSGAPISLKPMQILKVDFSKDFTTAASTTPTTTLAPIAPPIKTTPGTHPPPIESSPHASQTPSSSAKPPSSCSCPPSQTNKCPSPTPCTCPQTQTPSSNTHPSSVIGWPGCRVQCVKHNMCDCSRSPTHTTPCKPCSNKVCQCSTLRPMNRTPSKKDCSLYLKQVSNKDSSSSVSVGALVGSIIGSLVLGAMLGVLIIKCIVFRNATPQVRLVNSDIDYKY